ncbi:uncharacterized protein [Amphiura filiformis]|uniref:uncharacterized protein n=1 Tax=Amphiura filiformis TaxID=82378 RepID=UPI003B20FEFB
MKISIVSCLIFTQHWLPTVYAPPYRSDTKPNANDWETHSATAGTAHHGLAITSVLANNNVDSKSNLRLKRSNCFSCMCMEITQACGPDNVCVDKEDGFSVGAHCVHKNALQHKQSSSTRITGNNNGGGQATLPGAQLPTGSFTGNSGPANNGQTNAQNGAVNNVGNIATNAQIGAANSATSANTGQNSHNAPVVNTDPSSMNLPRSNCFTCQCMEMTQACPQNYGCVDKEHGFSTGPHCVHKSVFDGLVGSNGNIQGESVGTATTSVIQPPQEASSASGVNQPPQEARSSAAAVATFPFGTNGCPVQECTDAHDPQCGTNGRTYQNMCQFIAGVCKDNTLGLLHPGGCALGLHVAKSRCGACMCADEFPGCENGFTCMTGQGFTNEASALCVHNSVFTSRVNGNTDATRTGIQGVQRDAAVEMGPGVRGVQRTVANKENEVVPEKEPSTGFKCSVQGENMCQHKGYCEPKFGTCLCPWKYKGTKCETLVPHPQSPCITDPCPGDKTCKVRDIGRTCE